MKKNYKIIRNESLNKKVIFVDGLPGNGKTLFSSIIQSFSNVEKLSYAEDIEIACALYELNKVSLNTASALIKNFSDFKIYNQMMSRDVNFRQSDLSSIFNYPNPQKYINRIFNKGDQSVIGQIKKENPILHYATHNILSYSQPIFNALGSNALFLDIRRHPAYMIKQLVIANFESLIGDVRNWTIHYESKKTAIPYYVRNWEDKFHKLNNIERAIFFIKHYIDLLSNFMEKNKEISQKQILTIPFEPFVLNPNSFLIQMKSFLGVKSISNTNQVLSEQNIPRKKVAQGIDLEIYKRCGWVDQIDGLSERDEINVRKEWVESQVNSSSNKIFLDLCNDYEKVFWKIP